MEVLHVLEMLEHVVDFLSRFFCVTYEWYSLAIDLIEYLKQRQMSPKVAVVGNPPAIDGFGVRVAQNRGTNAEFFSSQQEALHWLGQG